MPALQEGAAVEYRTEDGERASGVIEMLGLEIGLVMVRNDETDETEIVIPYQIDGVELSEDGDAWEIDLAA